MRISLIVPNLNEAEYLPKFLSSLSAQTHKDWELVFIDGGSKDGSRAILERWEQKNWEFLFLVGADKLVKLIDCTRNIGYIRNVGAQWATGEILLHTSSDVMLDPWVLERVNEQYSRDPRLISLTARTKPVGSKVLAHLAYQGFDLLRWAFSKFPSTLRKYRPSGNFFSIKRDVFLKLGGFPEVAINEDGLFGYQLDRFIQQNGNGFRVKFDLGLCSHHHVKRFEQKGSIKTILFYVYVFANMFPFLKRALYKVEANSAEIFKQRSDLRRFKD